MTLAKTLRRRTAAMTAKQKKTGLIAVVAGSVLGAVWLVSAKTTPPKRIDDKLAVEVVTPSKRNIDVENLNAQITALQRQVLDAQSRQQQAETQLNEKLGNLADQITKANSSDEVSKRVAEAVGKAKITTTSSLPAPGDKPAGTAQSLPAPGTTPALSSPLPGMVPTGMPTTASANGSPSRGIEISGEEEESDAPTSAASTDTAGDKVNKLMAKKAPEAWFPMGSILSGVALNGGDFPVTSSARRDPLPMLIRLKKDAILPSRARASVKECFVMVSGAGDMSTSRASLRAERMSCVLEGNRAVEIPISGYVVGEDGKPGIHGRLVTKEAEVIAKALRVGLIGALGVGLTGYIGSELAAQAGGVNVAIGSGGIGGGGGGGGGGAGPIGKSFEKITDYYSSLAKEIVPVIEINPLRSIDIVLVRGFGIPLK